MNYGAHYDRLMARARDRATTRKQAIHILGYVERHRILPGCMGGKYTPDNIAYLTGEEHYVAHQLLVKIYPQASGLAVAAVFMAKQSAGNKPYGWLRRRWAESLRGHSGLGPSQRGVPKSPEHRAKIGAAWLGVKRGPMTAEHKAKLSAAHIGKPHAPEHLTNLRAALKKRLAGNTHTKGKKLPPRSEETLRKMSLAQLGKKKPPRSPEHCAAISQALRARRARS